MKPSNHQDMPNWHKFLQTVLGDDYENIHKRSAGKKDKQAEERRSRKHTE